jgi:hypothetical protein
MSMLSGVPYQACARVGGGCLWGSPDGGRIPDPVRQKHSCDLTRKAFAVSPPLSSALVARARDKQAPYAASIVKLQEIRSCTLYASSHVWLKAWACGARHECSRLIPVACRAGWRRPRSSCKLFPHIFFTSYISVRSPAHPCARCLRLSLVKLHHKRLRRGKRWTLLKLALH